MYGVEVRPIKREATAGRYEIKIAELRDAHPDDDNRIAAEKLFAEGEALRLEWTARSFRRAIPKYQAALALWRSLKDLRGEGATLNLIGTVHSLLGERQKQLEYLKLCSSDAFLLLRAQTAGVSVVTLPLLWAALHASKDLISRVKVAFLHDVLLPGNRSVTPQEATSKRHS